MTTTISSKSAADLSLGDRLSVPDIAIMSPPIRFVWRNDHLTVVEFTGGGRRIWLNTDELRVVTDT